MHFPKNINIMSGSITEPESQSMACVTIQLYTINLTPGQLEGNPKRNVSYIVAKCPLKV